MDVAACCSKCPMTIGGRVPAEMTNCGGDTQSFCSVSELHTTCIDHE